MEKLSFVFVVFVVMVLLVKHTYSQTASDAATLLRLKHAMRDPTDVLNSWNESMNIPYCQWIGVTCSSTGRVSGLRLQSLSGAFPFPIVQELIELRNLSASNNNFTEFLMMSKEQCLIEHIDISLSGLSLDSFIDIMNNCQHLRSLKLSNNAIQGTIPDSVFKGCNRLQILDLSGNFINGNIPTKLRQCNDLEDLSLAFNNLSGVIPSLSKRLKKLNLSANGFHALQQSTWNLEKLDISNNSFSGPFIEHFKLSQKNFSSLVVLDASLNKFTGEISVGTPSLLILKVSSNKLTKIGNICSSSPYLQQLIIADNMVKAPILSNLTCKNLKVLDLSFNFINEAIPLDLSKRFPKLEHLVLFSNALQGSIPESLGDCISLQSLSLSYNRLKGTIPDGLSKLKNLAFMLLSNNRLTGRIPASFGQLKKLFILVASNNLLEGEIPVELSSCEKLQWLDLNSNFLTGRIPPHIGRTKPAELIDNRTAMYKFIFDVNAAHRCQGKRAINDFFPLLGISLSEFKKKSLVCGRQLYIYQDLLRNVDSLILLDLSNNLLNGSIPWEIGNMRRLLELNLAHNLLTGEIPWSLGLHNLATLDLSENLLHGGIPNPITQLAGLSDFNVSYNNLSGPIPQQGQMTTFPLSSYEGNVGLCGYPVIPCDKRIDHEHPAPSTSKALEHDHNDDTVLVATVAGAISFLVFAFATFCCSWPWGYCKL